MDIVKGGQGGMAELVSSADLALIHQQSRKELTAEEVYTFSVRLCDNMLDRDLERFTKRTLEELAPLFVGKSGIFDHNWTAMGQACRIYKTEVVQESSDDPLGTGEGTYYLKGYVYMVRTESNGDLIAEIEAGIKREVSVGCGVAMTLCSICGEDMVTCPHTKGEFYEGVRCYGTLEGATDAYEFSFVAVPAQPKAGVMKSKEQNAGLYGMLRGLLDNNPGYLKSRREGASDWCSATASHEAKTEEEVGFEPVPEPSMEEMSQLKAAVSQMMEEAKIGRSCLEELQGEVKRLGAMANEALSAPLLEAMVSKMDVAELTAMKTVFAQGVEKRYPVQTQLDYGAGMELGNDGAFLI